MAECLRDVCRLCGEKGAAGLHRRKPHNKEKYRDVILQALDLDVSQDVLGTHPPFLCHNCFKKLDLWHKALKLQKQTSCNIKVATFFEHECSQGCAVVHLSLDDLSSICNRVIELASQHGCMTWRGPDRLKVMKFGESGYPEVELSIFNDVSWRVDVCGFDVTGSGCSLFVDVPASLGYADVEGVVRIICENDVCTGNGDYPLLVKSKEGSAGQIPVTITGRDTFQIHPYRTIRHRKCSLLVSKPKMKCDLCQLLRVDLSVLSSRLSNVPAAVLTSSTVRNDVLSNSNLQRKMKLMKAEIQSLKRRSGALQEKVRLMIEGDSITLPVGTSTLVHQAMEQEESAFMSAVPEHSYAALLWEQQKKSFQKGKGMRWHPAIIRFCLALQSKSSATYDLLRESGFLKLPHPNTLHPYTHFGEPTAGFNSDLVLRIVEDINLYSLPEHERNITIMFDEMKIKAGLVYSVRSGAVVGFVDVGSIANEILQFEVKCKGGKVPIASHVLVLMIRGIFTSLRSPIGYYPSLGISSHQLYPCIWEAINLLEAVGFIVRSLASDGASANRKFYRIHGPRNSFTHSVSHPAAERDLFFFCDAPHLMKTTRNNWENSGFNNMTRNLHFQKQDIKWTHLLMLYDWDIGKNRSSPGLRRLYKITYEHLHLTPTLRMRVYMATQVLSITVANAFKAFGCHDTSSTQLFVSKFDQFF
ncbi:uncharacterized protein LOC117293214 [Asterias rubens]|uniref:uncharacterized protein LOC117293214 n=1 Tax=Asterias rubens TaxID=7604 RepID=UPI00145572F7|nr:uncharacterized protein LOC117293214 [Asterias rubens]